ncbi:endo-1,4-beta-xylanase [Nafulsella turpanensis]|uniref:endo-1,4-beta-xylanase n=1 Tax=Nafulsella turpanensis TaxID=1265690 RepID=UPI00034A0AF5|nr:endo-1,4-beta-xylanase [Nafulsella turpanensis]
MSVFYKKRFAPLLLLACTGAYSCSSSEQAAEETPTSLKEAAEGDFYIGAALNYDQVYGREEEAVALIKEEFNTISPENMLKMGPIHPEQNVYNFEPADKYVAFGEENDMFTIGHTLVWHSQAPDWIFVDKEGNTVGRDTLLQRMEDHIATVAGRYKGKIDGWDVVNEALEDDGSLRQTKWLEIIGEEYLQKAFEFAKEADPEAELYYNDYSLWKPAKREAAVHLVKNLQEKGIQVDGVGMQGHYGIDYPSLEDIEASINAFADLGVKVMITELDVDLLPNPSNRQGADIAMTFEPQEGFNPYAEGLPDSVQQKLTRRYADLFELFHKHRDKISRVTFWGVADKHSWLNDWPMEGRRSYPLLFDRDYQPKPAYEAVMEAVSE